MYLTKKCNTFSLVKKIYFETILLIFFKSIGILKKKMLAKFDE